MWIPMTDEEIRSTRKNTAISRLIAFFILYFIFFGLLIFFKMVGYEGRYRAMGQGMNWQGIAPQLPMMFLVTFGIAVLLGISFLLGKKKMVICPKCDKLKKDDGKNICECGENFIDSKLLKWVED